MRIAFLALLTFLLAGCGYERPNYTMEAREPADVKCRSVATDRASDAGYMGEDGKTQQAIFTRAYDDCVSWRQAHS